MDGKALRLLGVPHHSRLQKTEGLLIVKSAELNRGMFNAVDDVLEWLSLRSL